MTVKNSGKPKKEIAKKIGLLVEKREVLGRKVKVLRKEGKLPANIYGKKIKSQAVVVSRKEFFGIYKQAGATGVVYLSGVGKDELPVLVRNLQYHPVTDELLHVEFYKVDLTKKTVVEVPVHITGEAPAVKEEGGVLVQNLTHVEVEALPADIPEKIEVEVGQLVKIDDGVLVKDLKIDKSKVMIITDAEEVVVKIEPPAAEEEEPVVEEVESEEGEEEEKKEGDKADEGKGKPGEKTDDKSDDKTDVKDKKPADKGGEKSDGKGEKKK